MNRKEQIMLCETCINHSKDDLLGVICGKISEKPVLSDFSCSLFQSNISFDTIENSIEKENQINQNVLQISDLSVCYYCSSKGLSEQDRYCPNCGFPQRGTHLEMKIFVKNIRQKKKLLEDKKNAVNKARNILFILAGLNFLLGIIFGLIVQVDYAFLVGSLIGAGIYFALGMWSKTKPFAAILSGLFVYIVFMVLMGIIDPHTLYKGFIWKIIIISGFIYGYKGVKDSERLEVELQTIKESKDLSEHENMQ